MGRLFSPDSGLYKGLSMVGDLMLLNFLFILCCIPVVTAGASAVAMYTVTLKIAAGEEGGVVKPFFKAFKGSLFRATAMWLIFLAAGYLVVLGIRVISANPGALPWVFNVAYAVVGILILAVMTWAWPMEAKFINTMMRMLKNAFILAMTHPLITLAAMILRLIPVALAVYATYWFLATAIVWFLFGFSGIAMINSLMFNKVFQPLIKKNKEG